MVDKLAARRWLPTPVGRASTTRDTSARESLVASVNRLVDYVDGIVDDARACRAAARVGQDEPAVALLDGVIADLEEAIQHLSALAAELPASAEQARAE